MDDFLFLEAICIKRSAIEKVRQVLLKNDNRKIKQEKGLGA